MIIPRVFFRSRVFGVATVLFTVIVLGSAIQPYLKRYQNAVSSSGPEQLFNTIFVTTGGYPLFSVCLFALCPPTKPILFLYAANTTFGLIFTTWFLGPLIFPRRDIWLGVIVGVLPVMGAAQVGFRFLMYLVMPMPLQV